MTRLPHWTVFGPLGPLALGLAVLGSELLWGLRSLPRQMELALLRRRLRLEQARLQRPCPRTRQARTLAPFLESELDLLQAELDAARQRYVARRVETFML